MDYYHLRRESRPSASARSRNPALVHKLDAGPLDQYHPAITSV